MPLSDKIRRQMAQRGWSETQIEEAKAGGERTETVNLATRGPATRYIHPTTRRSVVIDDDTGDVIHVGDDGFLY